MGDRWAPAALAWSFLTIVPSPPADPNPRTLAWAVALFPLVGGVLGVILGGAGLVLDRFLPLGPIAVLLVAASAFITGGLHLDGLMDTADGVFGGKTVERRLEIMRDSRVGSFGALAGALALLGEYASLAQLSGVSRLLALVTAVGISRWVMALAIGAFPSARVSGLGATFHQAGARRWTLIGATAIAVLLAAVSRVPGFVALVGAALIALLGGRFLVGRLGGLTGDTYGALAVVAEVFALYVAVGTRGA